MAEGSASGIRIRQNQTGSETHVQYSQELRPFYPHNNSQRTTEKEPRLCHSSNQ